MRLTECLPNAGEFVSLAQRLQGREGRCLTQLYVRLLHDAIAQHADRFDLELDQVARLKKAQLLEAATVAHGARAEELAHMQRLRARRVGDAVLELPVHVARVAAAPLFAVDARDHLEPVRVADFVRGNEAGAHGVAIIKVLALPRPQLPRHLLGLLVTRREVVEDGIAEDVLACAAARDVFTALGDVAAELELVVEALGVARPGHVGIGAADREAVRVIEDRALVPDLRNARRRAAQLRHRLEGLAQVLFETEKVAHLRRHRHRREKLDLVAAKAHGGRGRLEELADRVEGRLARLDDMQHGLEEGRGTVVDAAVSSLQIEHLTVVLDQRAGTRRGASQPERDESHGRLPLPFSYLIIHFASCTRRRSPCASSTRTRSPPRLSNASSAAQKTRASARSSPPRSNTCMRSRATCISPRRNGSKASSSSPQSARSVTTSARSSSCSRTSSD